jgi:hypothetical protein
MGEAYDAIKDRDHAEDGAKGGRPRYYETPEALQAGIDAYFDGQKDEYFKNDDGSLLLYKGEPVIKERKPITLNGLVYFLGFATRDSFDEYGRRKDGYSDVITRAKLRIAAAYEGLFQDPALKPQGPIFILSNMGMKNNQSIEHSGSVTIIDDIPKNA